MICPSQTTGLEYQIGTSFASTAKQAGLDIQVKSLPGSAFGDAFSMGDYDLTTHWTGGMSFDPGGVYGGFHSDNYTPVGQRQDLGGDQGKTRYRNPELDTLIDQMDVANPEDESIRPVYDQALDLLMNELPIVASIQTLYPFMFSTQYWTGYPSEDNPYTIPANWWGQFMFVIGTVQPVTSG